MNSPATQVALCWCDRRIRQGNTSLGTKHVSPPIVLDWSTSMVTDGNVISESNTLKAKGIVKRADFAFCDINCCSSESACGPNKLGWHDHRCWSDQVGQKICLRCAFRSPLSTHVGHWNDQERRKRPLNVHCRVIEIIRGKLIFGLSGAGINGRKFRYDEHKNNSVNYYWHV